MSALAAIEQAFRRADEVRAGRDGLNITIHEDRAASMADAKATDLRRSDVGSSHPASAILGQPVAVKDNIATLGLPTTCGSRILEGYRSPYEATAIRRLRAAGGIVISKTNCDEFAMGSSTEHSALRHFRRSIQPEQRLGRGIGQHGPDPRRARPV